MIQIADKISEFFHKYPNYKELIISNIKGEIAQNNGIVNFDGSREDYGKLLTITGKLSEMESDKGYIERADVIHTISKVLNENTDKSGQLSFFLPKKIIRARSGGQEQYIEKLNEKDLAVAIGPAGTGKTFLAVAKALSMLLKKEIGRIVLTRPAVEAGENLGFLPGDMKEKIDPYLKPLYDALYDMVDKERIDKYLRDGIIEIAPLAFMRGRTLSNSFIILDEAQNTTSMQMKMFITRLGTHSKAAITGDVTQIDLSMTKKSGLIELQQVAESIPGIGFSYLTSDDVVRHPLVKEIIDAYAQYDQRES